MTLKHFITLAVFLSAGTLTWAQPSGADYPSKPIRIVVPFGAGGVAATLRARFLVRSEDAELTETVVEYSSIEKAKTVFQWGPAPKPGSKKS